MKQEKNDELDTIRQNLASCQQSIDLLRLWVQQDLHFLEQDAFREYRWAALGYFVAMFACIFLQASMSALYLYVITCLLILSAFFMFCQVSVIYRINQGVKLRWHNIMLRTFIDYSSSLDEIERIKVWAATQNLAFLKYGTFCAIAQAVLGAVAVIMILLVPIGQFYFSTYAEPFRDMIDRLVSSLLVV